MRILVTGATGYIGRSIATALSGDGHDVLGLTRDPTGSRATALQRVGVSPVAGDVADVASYEGLLPHVDAVVHTVVDADDPVGADQRLFAAVRQADTDDRRSRHVVYTTGCSTYGSGVHTVLTETTPVDPENRRARLEVELADTGLAHTIIRPAFVHGADARSSIVGRWFGDAADGRAVHHGEPGKLWSWVHVDDVGAAYAAVLREPAAHDGQVYLLADDQAAPALTVLTAAARTAGYEGPVAFAPIADELPTYRGFDHDEVIDSTKARSRLGWIPTKPGVLDDMPTSFTEWRRASAAR
ncbi:NAD-dependent epimerase/dehydratase family protein [Curtobacterium sp. RRHDQ10]|uniref:NAD-dependent epimerase/dehydratase family protein n=1 Tax=Curtobacterium phyllosphaerae TaxID=3413379 RepID=UPI003BEF8A6A